MEDEEVWKGVVRYEGLYEVSSNGRVKSLSRLARTARGQRKVKEIILKSSLDTDGYPIVRLYKNGVGKSMAVHLLVAYSFLGHVPNGLILVIDHINGIKADPMADNLRIVTQRFNVTLGVRRDKGRLTSQRAGVSWHKNEKKWRAYIYINGKQSHLGYFKNELDASLAYIAALKTINKL